MTRQLLRRHTHSVSRGRHRNGSITEPRAEASRRSSVRLSDSVSPRPAWSVRRCTAGSASGHPLLHGGRRAASLASPPSRANGGLPRRAQIAVTSVRTDTASGQNTLAGVWACCVRPPLACWTGAVRHPPLTFSALPRQWQVEEEQAFCSLATHQSQEMSVGRLQRSRPNSDVLDTTAPARLDADWRA